MDCRIGVYGLHYVVYDVHGINDFSFILARDLWALAGNTYTRGTHSQDRAREGSC